ncbi:hypothetical protein BDAP_002450 [Binucleata daphniae]
MSTVSLTNLPTANTNCIKIAKNMFTTFNYHRCGDMIFSGHTLIITICALTWSSYDLLVEPRISRIACMLVWLTTFTICFSIILTRNHYSIDVLLSFYVTGSVWIIYGYIWDKHLSKEQIWKNLIINQ